MSLVGALLRVTMASMDSAQRTAWASGIGPSGRPPEELAYLCKGVLAVCALLWVAWTAMDVYKAWGAKQLRFEEAGGAVVQAVFILTLLLFFLRD